MAQTLTPLNCKAPHLFNKHRTVPVNWLLDLNRAIKWTATKGRSKVQVSTGDVALFWTRCPILIESYVYKKRNSNHHKTTTFLPRQTYFELIEVICAVFSGQTLHYARHWWVAQARPCKDTKGNSCMTKRLHAEVCVLSLPLIKGCIYPLTPQV